MANPRKRIRFRGRGDRLPHRGLPQPLREAASPPAVGQALGRAPLAGACGRARTNSRHHAQLRHHGRHPADGGDRRAMARCTGRLIGRRAAGVRPQKTTCRNPFGSRQQQGRWPAWPLLAQLLPPRNRWLLWLGRPPSSSASIFFPSGHRRSMRNRRLDSLSGNQWSFCMRMEPLPAKIRSSPCLNGPPRGAFGRRCCATGSREPWGQRPVVGHGEPDAQQQPAHARRRDRPRTGRAARDR